MDASKKRQQRNQCYSENEEASQSVARRDCSGIVKVHKTSVMGRDEVESSTIPWVRVEHDEPMQWARYGLQTYGTDRVV